MKNKIGFTLSLMLFVLMIDHLPIYAQIHYLQSPIGSPVTGTMTEKGMLAYAAGNGSLFEINSGGIVDIESSRSTKLLHGFHAKPGSYFHASSSLTFQGNAGNSYTMPRHILEGYLSKYIIMANFADNVDDISVFEQNPGTALSNDDWLSQSQVNDDVRMLINTGAKFVEHAAGIWDVEEYVTLFPNDDEDEAKFHRAELTAELVHSKDPEIILQALILENINTWMIWHENFHLPISSYITSNYNLTYTELNNLGPTFTHENIAYSGSSNLPDISKIECQLYFFYRAIRYIDAGYESINFARMLDRMSDNDPNHVAYARLLYNIRNYAKTHARRNFILITSAGPDFLDSNNDVVPNLRDFYYQPIFQTAVTGGSHTANNGSAIIAAGGVTIFGSSDYSEAIPYVVGFDNYGLEYCNYGPSSTNSEWWRPWGWDEITWFAMQGRTFVQGVDDYWELDDDDVEVRNDWLEYAYEKVRCLDDNGFLGMPGRRGITPSPIYEVNLTGCNLPLYHMSDDVEVGNGVRAYYRANTGQYNQEEKIKELWQRKEYLLTGINCSILPRYNSSAIEIKKSDDISSLQVSPNPFSDNLYLKLKVDSKTHEKAKVDLYDLAGRNISSIQTNTISLNEGISLNYNTIEKGAYILKVTSRSIRQTVKLIKQ